MHRPVPKGVAFGTHTAALRRCGKRGRMDVTNTIGAGGDLPAWVQAIGSIMAIIAAAGAAIGVPIWERHLDRQRANRSRLKVATREFANAPGLAVTMHFEPDAEHQGLVALVSMLKTPADLFLMPAQRNQPVDPLDLLSVTADIVETAKATEMPLLRMPLDPRPGYGAAVVICDRAMAEKPAHARIEIVVRTKIDRTVLAKQRFTVSPIS